MKRITALLTLILLLAACQTTEPLPSVPDEPPPDSSVLAIASFTATPSSIQYGGASTLSWSVSGATSLTINPGANDVTLWGNATASPTTTTVYTLTATNANGDATATTSVTVGSPPPPNPDPPEEPDPPEPEEPSLQYWVNSDCGEVSTTYATEDGGTAQRDFGNGVVYESDNFSSGDFVYISAQNQCNRGDVTVRIYKRGVIYRETTSSGAYVIATASGTF